MAKRSREDFEPSSPESESIGDTSVTARSVIHPSTVQVPSSASKFLQLGPESGEVPATEMRCSLPPHRGTLTFASFEEYDVHYAKTHTNRCLECRKNFPTEHFLNLHIEENHDAMISVLKERGEKTYSCFVEDCDKKCSTPQKRRMHLVDKHMFPKDYDFYVVNDGIDRRSSMLRSGKHRRRSSAAQYMTETERNRRRSSAIQPASTENGNGEERESPDASPVGSPASPKEDTDMDEISGAMSALKFVPPSVRFGRGRGRGRGGFSRS
ncbi:hypothetical protein VTL71DRAFT_16093 [Oculimacula yallundae]|uniref:C2H2-type domain-containing protein n=1 Tax=Oculimacula yallundae TaxID=86028 RepID=A0ABR4CDI4_9HELO